MTKNRRPTLNLNNACALSYYRWMMACKREGEGDQNDPNMDKILDRADKFIGELVDWYMTTHYQSVDDEFEAYEATLIKMGLR
mgnify:CR=1 FL=1